MGKINQKEFVKVNFCECLSKYTGRNAIRLHNSNDKEASDPCLT